jgi:hypothetical protein
MWPAKMAEGELCGAEWLRAHGLPVVKTIGKTPGRRPALVQERLASGSKELVSMFLRRDDRALLKSPLNGRTVRTLDRTIAKLRTMRFTLPDLQVLVARDGGIAFNDMVPPQRSRKPVTDLDLRFLLTLREAARYTVDLRGKTP